MRIQIIVLLALILSFDIVSAQPLEVTSPRYNEEICLNATLPITVHVTNPDSAERTLVTSVEIKNVVTNIVVYSASDTVRNLPPGFGADRSLPDYVTSANLLTQLGTFLTCTKLSAMDANDSVIRDWPFGDSICTPLFGVRTTNLPFNDPNNDYSVASFGDIPDQRKWMTRGSSIVDGEFVTWDPPPPRIEPDDTTGFGKHGLRAPVVLLDRKDRNGKLYEGIGVGDTITSLPFNLKGQSRANLSFDFQRGGKIAYPLQWDDAVLRGPESIVLNTQNALLRTGDSLIIEFKDTTSEKCNPEKWNRITGIGGGQDFTFEHFWLAVPRNTKYFDSTFRFRIILKASDDADSVGPRDDTDPWYLDNIMLQVPRRPEIEVMWARVVTPYTKLPYSATQALPVMMKLKNYTVSIGVNFPVRVSILNSRRDTVYSRITTVNSLIEGRDTTIRLPDWDARDAIGESNEFFVYGKIAQNGYDSYTDDNSTHSIFYLNVEQGDDAVQEFALDDAGITPVAGHGNDVPLLTQQPNQGIGFEGTSGSYAVKFILTKPDTLFGARIYFSNINSSPDSIRVSVYKGHAGWPDLSIATFLDTRHPPMNEFSKYLFPTPVALDAGIYWISVSQLSNDNYTLGGDISRGGARIGVADSLMPRMSGIYTSPYGTQTSPSENTGEISNMYAVEMPAGSGTWGTMTPSVGWWPVHEPNWFSLAIKLKPPMTAPFIGAGTYLPMIRPMVGSFGHAQVLVAKSPVDDFVIDTYPNPFAPGAGMANFIFTLPQSSVVSAIVFDDLGRALRRLADSRFEKGEHTLYWDGKDSDGDFVTNGIYTCQFSTSDRTTAVRLLVIR